MKVWEITDKFGLENLRFSDVREPDPGHGQLKLKVLASSINSRDLYVVEGLYGRAIKPPVVPMSDCVAEVVELGPGVTRFKKGDRVCPIFFPEWISGEPREEMMRLDSALGGSSNGVLADFIVVSEQSAVGIPPYLSDREAATLPCAAVTAWNALSYGRPIRPGETVLIQGTGGVSLFALQFAKAMGANTIVISSSDAKLARVRDLGADLTINYGTFPDWHQEIRKAHGGGVDRVIEVGGADTLAKSLKVVRVGGVIASVGVLSGGKAALDLPLVVMRNVRIEGITVGSRDDFEAMLRAMQQAQIRPQIAEVIPFASAPTAFDRLKSGGAFGKIGVAM
jgi:NADPH:quinone reductase-like Zn-dependent oxidoreductase